MTAPITPELEPVVEALADLLLAEHRRQQTPAPDPEQEDAQCESTGTKR